MGRILRADELRTSITHCEREIQRLEKRVGDDRRLIRTYKTRLRNLKKRVRCVPRRRKDQHQPRIDKEKGLEWYSFDVIANSNVVLKGVGWFLVTGMRRQTEVISAKFYFTIKLSDVTKELIKTYMPEAKLEKAGHKIMTSDIKTALTISQTLAKPERIVLVCKGVRVTRTVERKTTRNLRVARYVGDKNG